MCQLVPGLIRIISPGWVGCEYDSHRNIVGNMGHEDTFGCRARSDAAHHAA
jgi:hypothetical protein